MKKMFSLALALIMALALTVPAFAADDYTITITPPTIPIEDQDSGLEAYAAYKIFDATYDGENLPADEAAKAEVKISYTIDEDNPFYETIAEKNEWFTLVEVNGSGTYVVTPTAAFTTEKAIELGDLLKAVVDAAAANDSEDDDIAPDAEGVQSGENFELTVADKGYYFITSTLGSDIIVDTLSNVTIQSKNEYPSLAKAANKTNASFGEIITYTLTIVVPDSADKNVVVTDTMEAGLTFKRFTSAEETGVTAVNDGQVNTITIAPTSDSTARTVVVTYEAYINTASGEIFEEENTNSVYLTYSEYQSVQIDVDVVSYMASFKKIDGYTKEALEGVTFKLTETDGTEIPVVCANDGAYRVVDVVTADTVSATITTDENGVIVIEGLASGDYELVELSTLDGYNLLAEPVEFTIGAANNEWAMDDETTDEDETNNIIENLSGTVLPSTGGVGTTIFYAVGGILMVGAAVLLVTKKKLANQE